MIGRRHQIASAQSTFYRDSYHRVLRWLFIEIVVMFLLIAAIIYIILSQPAPEYYATTTGGQLKLLQAQETK